MIPTMWRDHTPYNHPSYDPVWAACQAANFPVHTHSGEAPREEMNEFIGIYLAEVVFWTHRPISHLLFSGAFERFPGLKFVVTEGACYWVADMKWKWDQYFGGGHTTKKMAALMKGILSKLPSEYFGTNIFVGASTMSKEEIRRRHTIGCDVAMWGTDYPHPEGTWPNTIERLRKDFGDVPVGDTRQLLGETAATCYGFDLDALRPIAERVGPTPQDLGQDPSLVTTPEEIRRGRVVEGRVPGGVERLRRRRYQALMTCSASNALQVESVGIVGRVERHEHLGDGRARPRRRSRATRRDRSRTPRPRWSRASCASRPAGTARTRRATPRSCTGTSPRSAGSRRPT